MTETLRGRRVLVTGADGFIGSHLVELLVEIGAHVRALVYYNSWNSLGWLTDVPAAVRTAVEIAPGDVRDAERLSRLVRDREYVFHLASLVGIPYSYEAPQAYVQTNVVGTLNVLEACRRAEALVRVIHTSTSEVYGTARIVPIAEDHPLVAQSPYSASKIGADKLAESFHLSFRLPVVTVRPFNTFGPRQTARAVIPAIASQLLSGVSTLRLGALTPTRDFNFVSDTAAGIAALALSPEAEGQVVNVGSGKEWSIAETASLLMDVCGRKVPIVSEESRVRPPASEVDRLVADTTRMRGLTDWVPRVAFRDGLALTADWISGNLQHFDPSRYAI